MGPSGECISAFTTVTAARGILRCPLGCYSRRGSLGQRMIAGREKLKHDFENRGRGTCCPSSLRKAPNIFDLDTVPMDRLSTSR